MPIPKKGGVMPPIKHVSLFSIIILIPLIITDKPNDRALSSSQKDKACYKCTIDNIVSITSTICIHSLTNIRFIHYSKAIHHKTYTSIHWRSQNTSPKYAWSISLLTHPSFPCLLILFGWLASMFFGWLASMRATHWTFA